MSKKALLVVVDGFGLNPDKKGNAVTEETAPFLSSLLKQSQHAALEASGPPIGLLEHQVGNSEVGHVTIGAGRILPSKLNHIKESFQNGSWAEHALWKNLHTEKRVHIAGLLSDAGVHAHYSTLVQSAILASRTGVETVYVHLFLDGVDSQAGTAPRFISDVQAQLADYENIKIGVVMGRRWAADRTGDLSVSQYVVDALTNVDSLPLFNRTHLDAHLAERDSEMDFAPTKMSDGASLEKGETIIFTSHRADRINQLASLLKDNNNVLSITELKCLDKTSAFFPVHPLEGGLIDEVIQTGRKISLIAESCKFPHITYFLSGFKDRDDTLKIEVPTIDELVEGDGPAMSINELEKKSVEQIDSQTDFIAINIPNLDQVGHTGNLEATRKSASCVDSFLRTVSQKAFDNHYTLIITSDHGNADTMLDEGGKPLGSHSPYPTPLLLIDSSGKLLSLTSKSGTLANVAPTVLQAMSISTPDYMEPGLLGESA